MPFLLSRGRLVWTSTLVTGASLALGLYLLGCAVVFDTALLRADTFFFQSLLTRHRLLLGVVRSTRDLREAVSVLTIDPDEHRRPAGTGRMMAYDELLGALIRRHGGDERAT
jgi:hypothetical protein